MRIFLPVFIVFAFSILCLSCGEDSPYDRNKNKDSDTLTEFYNVIIALDLTSDRLKNQRQVNSDITTIKEILGIFEDRQRRRSYKSLDKLTVDIVSSGQDYQISSSLRVEMSMNGGRKNFEDKITELNKDIESIYEQAVQNPHGKKDLYSYFRDYVPGRIAISDDNRYFYSNKLFLITDGTFQQEKSLLSSSSEYIGFSFSDVEKLASSDDWRGLYNTMSRNIEPIRNKNFRNLQVCISGLGKDLATENSTHFLIIEQFWKDWLDKMGIESQLERNNLRSKNNREVISRFFYSQHIQDKYSLPFQTSGQNYFLSYYPFETLVEGYDGTYFVINLTESQYMQRLCFNSGRYTIDNPNKYERAFVEFGENVIQRLKQDLSEEQEYKIFIRGSADQLGANTFRGRLLERFDFKEVCFYPQKGKGVNLYRQPLSCEGIPDIFNNNHLPNLRAEFVRKMFSKYMPEFTMPEIVQGKVSYSVSSDDRNVTLYLYLPAELYKN